MITKKSGNYILLAMVWISTLTSIGIGLAVDNMYGEFIATIASVCIFASMIIGSIIILKKVELY